MPIEAVKIPQNVYVEDRIIGPITLKHLVILGLGGGLSYLIYAVVTKSGFRDIVSQALSWTPLLIAAAFAFLRINDLSLFNIILLSIEKANKPNVRYWSPHPGLSINIITRQNEHELKKAQAKASDATEKLTEMTKQLEKKQAELQHMAIGDEEEFRPQAAEPLRPQIRDIIADTSEEPIRVTPSKAKQEHGSSLPVSKNRIQATAMDPALSIDTVAENLPTFQDFRANHY